jgi:6-phosphogluconolactonase
MDPVSGHLEKLNEVVAPGRPAPLAASPDRRFLYVGRREANEISSFSIDHGTGGLSLLGTAPLESDPCFLSTDRQGKFLLSSYYNAGHAGVHPIDARGMAGSPTIEWLATGTGAHSIQTDPSNRYAFVPHIDNRGGPNAIFQFRFDPATGHLTPNSPPRVAQPPQAGPRHFCFHPSKNILYFSNEQGCSITGYNFNPADGTLSAFQTISTLPAGFQGTNSCSQIQISPNGKFLYAPNRGHNSIAGFAVDAATGQLTALGQTPSEPTPRAFSLDPQGKFLYSAGLGSGRLAAFSIDGNSGRLTPLETYAVGADPMWVLITEL